MSARRMLIVDDEPDVLELLTINFTREGYDVVTATNGRDAVVLAEERHPNIVLLDYNLPVLDGLDALSRLREVIPDAVIIVITGRGSEEVAVEAMKRGANDYVRKPFDLVKLTKMARTYLGEYFDTIVRRNSDYEYPLDDEVIHRYEFLRCVYSTPNPDITKISARFGYSRNMFYKLDGQMRRFGVYGLFDKPPEELSGSLSGGVRVAPRKEISPPPVPAGLKERYPFSRLVNPNDLVQLRLEMLREAATSRSPHIGKICRKYGVSRQLFYTVYDRFSKHGALGLLSRPRGRMKKSISADGAPAP